MESKSTALNIATWGGLGAAAVYGLHRRGRLNIQMAKEIAMVSASTIAAGYTLETLYKVTGYYPPGWQGAGGPVFYGAIGALTHVGWEVIGGNRAFCETSCPDILGTSAISAIG